MICPECKNKFTDNITLKTKVIYLCKKCGLYSYRNGMLDICKYPCPKCKHNNQYPISRTGNYVICKCDIHGLYRINFLRSFNFRRLCSIMARKNNKDPTVYTKQEKKVKGILDNLGYKENKDYYHNKKIRVAKGRYYFPDFIVLNDDDKKVIEVSPIIWHNRYDNNDDKKINYFKDKGYDYIILSDRTMPNWSDIIRNELL